MAKSIMVQGTMSGAGKSLIAAALCRIFAQDGYKTAPFKSQNMALNSFVTKDGFEMGRAQVMQAEAAGVAPDVRMNPILLKPTSDIGSQVILNGKAIGNMRAAEYFKRKKEFIPDIMKAYNSLATENDIIVLEGAGSPAEINLKENDIVNMGMAKLSDSAVLLVGDIDRGGVFAQLYGTTELLEKDEKDRIAGLIVNKFRGDKGILQSGLDEIERLTNKPVIGVVPYVRVDIDEEDSLSERLNSKEYKEGIDIAVIRLEHISNYTDFSAFECIDGVNVRYVSTAFDLESADMIIVPGTKNTISDLKKIRENGVEAAVIRAANKGTPVWGVCGGYQILGKVIKDTENTEGGGELRGMGLLDCETEFCGEKKTIQSKGIIKNAEGIFKELNGTEVSGYEIHMGDTKINGKPLCIIEGENEGISCGNIYGSYLHGIFDNERVIEVVVSALAEKKGIDMSEIKTFNMKEYKEKQYDILADAVRENIDMKMIYKILDLKRR